MSDYDIPFLDRIDVDELSLTTDQRFWRRNGYLPMTQIIPESTLKALTGSDYPRDLFLDSSVVGCLRDLYGDHMGLIEGQEPPKRNQIWQCEALFALGDKPHSVEIESGSHRVGLDTKTILYEGIKGDVLLIHPFLKVKIKKSKNPIARYLATSTSDMTGDFGVHLTGGRYWIRMNEVKP